MLSLCAIVSVGESGAGKLRCNTPSSNALQHKVHLVTIFGKGAKDGNLAPIVADASGMYDKDMQNVARHYKHESGFVLPASKVSTCDFTFRYWVMNHEMEMCGHATVGAVWLLDHLGMLTKDKLLISTLSGHVEAHVTERNSAGACVMVSQPIGQVQELSTADCSQVSSVLGIERSNLAQHTMQNAATSRVKTLVPLKDVDTLDSLQLDFARIESVCSTVSSTGLYPYAVVDQEKQIFAARQFPKASGYPEDAATGIAAAALAFALLKQGLVSDSVQPICVQQGHAMGKPSEIRVSFHTEDSEIVGCWLGGSVRLEAEI